MCIGMISVSNFQPPVGLRERSLIMGRGGGFKLGGGGAREILPLQKVKDVLEGGGDKKLGGGGEGKTFYPVLTGGGGGGKKCRTRDFLIL